MYLEVRPRLGSVNAFIRDFEEGKKTVIVSSEGNLICVLYHSKIDPETYSWGRNYSWPSQDYGALCPKSVHGLNFQGEELTVRFRLKNSGLSLMLPKKSTVCRKFINPCHLSPDEKEPSLFCVKCNNVLAKLNIQRYLPLPSMDWRGGIQDWFCGCNHATEKTDCSSDNKSPKTEENSSNDRLHEKGLGPVPNDLLYSQCQIRLHSKYFSTSCSFFSEKSETTAESSSASSSSKVCCDKCQIVLGDHNENDNSVQLWHHTVKMNDVNQNLPTAIETFLLLIGGVCAEHDWLPIKIRLKSGKLKLETGNEKDIDRHDLFIWMLEPDLKLIKIQSNDSNQEAIPEELSLMKVMYINGNSDMQVDQELSVPSDVIQAGIEHLMENSAMIPLGQRQDSDFHISYISLNQVLEEKNKPNSNDSLVDQIDGMSLTPKNEGRINNEEYLRIMKK